jgi:hypothetical protein
MLMEEFCEVRAGEARALVPLLQWERSYGLDELLSEGGFGREQRSSAGQIG